jgi:hypothetical protein
MRNKMKRKLRASDIKKVAMGFAGIIMTAMVTTKALSIFQDRVIPEIHSNIIGELHDILLTSETAVSALNTLPIAVNNLSIHTLLGGGYLTGNEHNYDLSAHLSNNRLHLKVTGGIITTIFCEQMPTLDSRLKVVSCEKGSITYSRA